MASTSVRAQIMRARIAEVWANTWRWVLMAAGAALAVYLLLDRAVGGGVMTAAAISGLVIGAVLTASKPMAIALMAMPALFVVERAGLGAADLSVSDVALAAAFGTAVLLGERPYSGPLRQMLWFNLIYQFATIFTVIVNPQAANTIEWFHAWLLVSGALIVGWALGRSGYARLAFTLMVAAACVIGVGIMLTAVFQFAQGDFGPIYPQWPWPMQKNFAGTALSFVVLVLYTNPEWAELSSRWRILAMWFLVVAIVMTQSRQALIGLVVAVLVIAARPKPKGRSRLVLLLVIPAIWLIVSTVIEQIDSQNQHNSFFQRVDWLREVYAFWKLAPLFGHGLRFWYYNPVVPYQPPQAEVEVVAATGIVGLIGFAVMWAGILFVAWRMNPVYGTLAFTVLLSRLVQAQFDLFWVAAQVSIPFVIAGICVGAMARNQIEGGFGAADSATRRKGEFAPISRS